MNFSYNWLKELVEGLDAPPAELGRLITMKTAECEGIHSHAPWLEQVCAARVVSTEPVPGSKHNVKAVVDTVRYGVKTVVCGAPNCRPGMVTAYVPAGTDLNGRRIDLATIEGVASDGMLASGAELGVNRDEAGVLELDAAPGAGLPGCAPDSIIEIDNKSITHRPDLWGHFGLAREVAAILGKKLVDPVKLELIPHGPAPVRIEIEDLQLCPRYSALVFENITVGPSPLWLQHRLESIGLNSISNIVDVTNLIMSEIAQPMHAFDHDLLRGETIFARPARAGETLVALNEEMYKLDAGNLVIADARGPIALAGVMGGLDTAINERATRIVLESANFQASSIRKTSSKLKLRTDASMRYEKAQDPVNTLRGLARAVELLREVSPGMRIVGGLADLQREPVAPAPIRLPLDWLRRKLGRAIEPATVRQILESLEFGVSEPEPQVFAVSVPTWRATKDIAIKDDLVEEVGRMIGYSSIAPVAPLIPVTVPPSDESRLFARGVRAMAAAQGFTEVYNYSFLGEEQARELGFTPEEHLPVLNPIAANQGLMRVSLLPGILANLRDNSRHFATFRLFEIGYEIHKQPEGLPDEVPHFAAAMYTRENGEAHLFEVKRLAECLMPGAQVRPATPRAFEHPARAVEVLWKDRVMGRLFELHPSLIAGRAAILDIDLRLMLELRPREKKYQQIQRYPASPFDLSVIAGARELVGELQKRLADLAGERLIAIEFLRSYSGPPIPQGKQSVSFQLTVAAPDHTLSAEELAAIRSRIMEGMRSQGYELRA
ncbi:MAG TPA: phenylalanine--tRNA ligase subunit beta [Bryobacteraceae bacterium]|nr:phenylalanine--tRNA ligase subunit beta [Bryobacteraceae bacterium]